MAKYKKITPPDGEKITVSAKGAIKTPNNPIIPYIEGDGIGPDIWAASQRVFDAAVEKSYGGKRKVSWFEVYAGEKCVKIYGKDNWLADDTLAAIKEFKVGIKGPLTTPIGGGIRSINVALRQLLDLYQCIRPVRHFPNVPGPVRNPEDVDMVLFRENTEDIYAGVEWAAGTKEARKIVKFLKEEMKVTKIRFPSTSSIGIKPISRQGTYRLVRKAIEYAIANKRRSVTLVHKGNIMKFTEGYFKKWGYEIAKKEFGSKVVSWDECKGKPPKGKVLIQDVIADAMLQQVLTRPKEYDVIATMNLNGDYLSDALAAQVGGIGIAPGANVGDRAAVFEATHGTAPKYAGLDKVNPSSVILSGEMMFRHIGWAEAADKIVEGLTNTFKKKIVTYDFARLMRGAKEVKCSQFGDAIVDNM